MKKHKKTLNRTHLFYLANMAKREVMLTAIALFVACVIVPAYGDERTQQNLRSYGSELLVPGYGIGSIVVGKTTLREVRALFGETNAVDPVGQQVGYFYANGLRIYVSPPDTDAAVVVRIIGHENPYGTGSFQGATDKGIRIGDSRESVLEAYGKPDPAVSLKSTMFYRQGITFTLDNAGRVTTIVVQTAK